uniref:hypothetical protein n=1 Tax=Citrobacter freundii TaxID=546 RepID=UPI0020180F82|nr:hypothetical protein [Citrobacter freundii]
MGLLKMRNLHSVTDKALDDVLNQSEITLNELRELFLVRGILISKETPRKELARNFSKFSHDYYDHQKIASYVGSNSRREKSTSKIIATKIEVDEIIQAAEQLKVAIEAKNDLCHISTIDGKVRINVTYLSTDYGKSDFKQVITKNALIEVEPSGNGFLIRRPENDQTQDYEDSLLASLEHIVASRASEGDKPRLDVKEISLEHIADPKLRTKFFVKLINGLKGYILDDVTDAYVYHPKPEKIKEEDGNSETGVHIHRASLKGEGVLKSEELSSLYDRGFYICKIKWMAKEDLADPDIYEFEAQFSDQGNFKDFSYLAKGVKKYKGSQQYNKNFVSLSKNEETFFAKLIESTAYSIIMEIESGKA